MKTDEDRIRLRPIVMRPPSGEMWGGLREKGSDLTAVGREAVFTSTLPEGPVLGVVRIVLSSPPGIWTLDAFEVNGYRIETSPVPGSMPLVTEYRPIARAIVRAGEESTVRVRRVREGQTLLSVLWWGEEA